MQLFHITSLKNAYSIVSTGRYRPCYPNPLAQDSGMNAGIVGEFLSHQAFEATGVKLIFEWSGPVSEVSSFPLPKNLLLVNLPWRVVVSHGTTQGLTAIGIEVEDVGQYRDLVRQPAAWLPRVLKDYWLERRVRRFKARLAAMLAQKPNIIVLP